MSERPKTDPLIEFAILTSTAVSLLGMSGISSALPEIKAAFAGVPNVAYLTKMVVSLVGVAMVVVSPLTGLFFRLLGPRTTLIIAYAVFLVAGVGGLWIPSLWGVLISRFLVGAGCALIVTSCITLISVFHDEQPRELRIGLNQGIGTLLTSALLPIAGILASRDWRLASLPYLIVLPAFLAVIFSPALRNLAVAPKGKVKASGKIPTKGYAFLLVALASGALAFTIQVFLPFRVADLGKADPGFAGTLLGISFVCSVTTSFLYAFARKFLSASAMFAVIFGGWIIAFGLIGIATERSTLLIAMAFIGIPGGLMAPNIFSIASRLVGDDARVKLIGLAKGTFYFGPFVGPTLLAPVERAYGAQGAFLAMSAAAAVLTVLSVIGMVVQWRQARAAVAA
jgi:MFS family permease